MRSAIFMAFVALSLMGCGRKSVETDKIALLLPENKTTRYESQDRPYFEAKVMALCPACEVLYFNANQDPAKQQQQVEAALTQGAKVLVLDPVDSKSAAASARLAKQRGVPVVSYDRLILNAPVDLYISFDNVKVGALQAQGLLAALGETKDRQIVMINGSPTDNNAKLFKQGAHSVLDGSGLIISKEYDTPDWSPDKAQQQMEQAITALGKDKIAGVYAANDGMAGGIIAALKGAGLDPLKIPVTGQDAEIAGVQRVLAGTQALTIYKAMRPEAEAAAQIAVSLMRKEALPAGLINGTTANGTGEIASVLLPSVIVTRDNAKATIFADGFVKATEVCVGEFAAACAALQIQ